MQGSTDMSEERGGLRELLTDAFWLVALAAVSFYAFLVVLGAYSPLDAVGITVAVVVLAALWGFHALRAHRHRRELMADPRLHKARERRGF